MRRKWEETRSPSDILAEAEEILGPAVKVEWHRNWAIFWCPFHNDIAKQGKRGRPNFGVNLEKGYWKCLRCGASGPSLKVLRKRLGKGWTPPRLPERQPREPQRPPFSMLAEAMAVARANFRGSPAERYLAENRHIRPAIASMYGVGYGVAYPPVSRAVLKAAQAHHVATKRGWWIWAGGVVYAEPPMEPETIDVRHLRENVPRDHQRWGSPSRPGGAWRIGSSTEVIIVVEGLMDMLSFAQVLHDKGWGNRIVPVYTGGSGGSQIYQWLKDKSANRELIIVPDNDDGGRGLAAILRRHGVKGQIVWPPEGKDPNDVIPKGWWPFPF